MGTGTLLVFLTILSEGVLAGTEWEADRMYDPRCGKEMNVTVENFRNKKERVEIFSEIYKHSGKVVCTERKRQMPALSQHDDWVQWISFIRNVTYRGDASCTQFAAFYKRAFTALGNMRIRKNCTIVPVFCSECSLPCPHVSPGAYSTRKQMIAWSIDTLDLKMEGQCQIDWTAGNIKRAAQHNETWLKDVRMICESCFENQCSSKESQQIHDVLLAELRKGAPGREQQAFKRICLFPVVKGIFTVQSLHLERRFGFFDMWLALRLAAQQCSDVAVLVIIMWSIMCIIFFNTDSKARDLFDPYHESARRELADKLLNWLKRNLASKKNRKRTRRGKKYAKWQNKKENVKKSKRRLPADTPILQLANGKIAGPRRGPAGRGGRRRGLNW